LENKVDKNSIKCPNIILCEGKDEWSFLIYYLQYLIKQDPIFDTFQVMDFGGITDLNRQFRQLLKMPGFSIVKTITILRDAEKEPRGAKDSICSTLKSNGYLAPSNPGEIITESDNIKIAYMLFPSCDDKGDDPGTLEDLCLRIISAPRQKEVLNEIDGYLNTLSEQYEFKYPRIHKNRLHLFISSYDKFVDAKAGEAGQRGLYDWNSKYLEKLKMLLYNIAK